MRYLRKISFNHLLILTLALVFLARLHLSLTRAFDPDEFAHMHWAWLVKSGHLPYRDFFFYNTPLYQFLMAPVFFLPEGAGVVIVIRLLQLAVFGALTTLIFLTSRKIHLNTQTALLSALIFSVFPMNMDKSVDIRPDVLMLTLYFLAACLLLSRPLTKSLALAGGIIIGAAVLIMPKIVFALPALFYLYLLKCKSSLRHLPSVITGVVTTALLVFLPVILAGSLPDMVRSVFSDSVTVNAGKTPFSPWKALSPWPLVYTAQGGPNLPWRVNTALWILAVTGFFSYFLRYPRSGIFFLLYIITGLVFLFAFPAPYLQYFLPLSVIASILAAYTILDLIPSGFRVIFARSAGVLPAALLSVAVFFLSSSFFIQYRLRVSPGWNNSEQLQVLDDVARVIRPNERIYDMVGSYVFRHDAYFFCCHPYAEFVDRLDKPYQTLKEAITETRTKFVILDRTGMAFWQPKPEDLKFIERHFVESPYRKIYFAGQQFACTGGACELLNVHGHGTGIVAGSVEIFVPETYEIKTVPPDQPVTVDGTPVSGSLNLTPGIHPFSVASQLTEITFRIKR